MKNLKLISIGSFLIFFLSYGSASSQTYNTDISILDDEIELIFSGENSTFIYHEVKRKISYRINTEAGIKRVSEILLPETFDPVMINHFPEARNYDHVYSRMTVDKFDAKIITSKGETRPVEIEDEEIRHRIHMLDEKYYGNYFKYKYNIAGLEVGDQVDIEYQYNVLFNENFLKLTSNRIFFHSDIPKKKFSLSIKHHNELVVEYEFFNGSEPETVYDEGNNRIHTWTMEDLAPSLAEPGSRPYLDLPHITFTVRPYNSLYVVPNTFEERLKPLYTHYVEVREDKHFNIALSIMQGVNTRQFNNIEKFVEKETSSIDNDSSGYQKILKIHNKIADEFEFDDDLAYFIREDRRDPRMGDYLAAGKIRDIARNEIYLALIKTTGLRYFTTYLCDVRAGVINENFLVPMHYSDLLYATILNNEDAVIMYPKKSRFGYYLNEIPFYYEGSHGLLIHINDYLNTEQAINEDLRFISLPRSGISDNIRNSRIMAVINLDDNTVNFSGLIKLNGQFSTMTRGLYLFDYSEPGINNLYTKKIWDISDDVSVKSSNIEVLKKEAPYTTNIKTSYTAKNLLKTDGNEIKLSVKDWFNHIIYEDFESERRTTDFYFDFAGRDSYSYTIQFDKDVTLRSSVSDFELNTEEISCIIKVDQIDKRTIKIDSYLAVGIMVESGKCEVVEKAFKALQELNGSEIVLIMD